MNERIKKLRKELGLTLEKFGERLGVKKAAISLIENGKSSVTDQMFKSICREFGVREEWLRDGTGSMFAEPDDSTAALVSNLLENPDNPFYSTMLDIMKAYEQLQPESQKALEALGEKYIENARNRKA